VAFRRELRPELEVVVDLSVQAADEPAVAGAHRLVARRAEIENRQTAVAEHQSARPAHAFVVGTAVPQARQRGADAAVVVSAVRCPPRQDAGNAAHV
jgi:hypothetical protein